ncbi:MAG: hypothetical protein ACJ788_09645 [Ktedonobacteraceae bacterium]
MVNDQEQYSPQLDKMTEELKQDLTEAIVRELKANKLDPHIAQRLAARFLELLPFKDYQDVIEKIDGFVKQYDAQQSVQDMILPAAIKALKWAQVRQREHTEASKKREQELLAQQQQPTPKPVSLGSMSATLNKAVPAQPSQPAPPGAAFAQVNTPASPTPAPEPDQQAQVQQGIETLQRYRTIIQAYRVIPEQKETAESLAKQIGYLIQGCETTPAMIPVLIQHFEQQFGKEYFELTPTQETVLAVITELRAMHVGGEFDANLQNLQDIALAIPSRAETVLQQLRQVAERLTQQVVQQAPASPPSHPQPEQPKKKWWQR